MKCTMTLFVFLALVHATAIRTVVSTTVNTTDVATYDIPDAEMLDALVWGDDHRELDESGSSDASDGSEDSSGTGTYDPPPTAPFVSPESKTNLPTRNLRYVGGY